MAAKITVAQLAEQTSQDMAELRSAVAQIAGAIGSGQAQPSEKAATAAPSSSADDDYVTLGKGDNVAFIKPHVTKNQRFLAVSGEVTDGAPTPSKKGSATNWYNDRRIPVHVVELLLDNADQVRAQLRS
jgi:hypothetical protein